MKQQQELKCLYWKSDKEQIMQIMHHLNIKYLLSLYKKAIYKEHAENDWKTAYVSIYQIIKYDGCIFQASVKTLKDELKHREVIGEVIPVYYRKPSGRTFKINWEINKDYKK